MNQFYSYLIPSFFIFTTIILCNDLPLCSICLQPITQEYSVDAWGNPFHRKHEMEGIFCHSCSRIISQEITQGGYRYKDGRHICSLCQVSIVVDDPMINASYKSVITQFESIGIHNFPNNINIQLIDLIDLNNKFGTQKHGSLKGVTHTGNHYNLEPQYTIFILSGLPKIEFEAVLAHELLHIWLYDNNYHLNQKETEGFCNLGSQLIYKKNGTHFSKIHLQAMENDPHLIYGDGYRKMNAILRESNWKNLLKNLHSFE